MRKLKILTILGVLSLLLIGMVAGTAKAQGAKPVTYSDERYDFSVQYPSDWVVSRRQDRVGTYGEVLTFRPRSWRQNKTNTQIVVGLYTVEREDSKSLGEWTREYESLSSPFPKKKIQIETEESVTSSVAQWREAFVVRGSSPITHFEYTNIPRGGTVWFVWTNGDASTQHIYNHLVESFTFGSKTPMTLRDAFGPDFQPRQRQPRDVSTESSDPESIAAVQPLPDGSWRAPVPAGQNFTVNCGSSFHTGTAAYATDISMGVGTNVYSAKTSWVDFAGWDNTGYGNLIKSNTDYLYPLPYLSYYAHLNDFLISPGQKIATLKLIAHSGNTGTTAAHLHFHVRTSTDPVNLSTITNFNENGLYPSGAGNCGTMYR